LIERIAWPAVLAAGLLDGVNPCAFVTVIFLLSYLSLLKYRRRDAMLVGAAFTAAMFATYLYLLIGLGFLAFAGYLQEQPHFQDVVPGRRALAGGVAGGRGRSAQPAGRLAHPPGFAGGHGPEAG
jgi:hypothetical protein